MAHSVSASILLLFLATGAACAQKLDDRLVSEARRLSLESIHTLKCDGGFCSPATAAEKAKHPISMADSRKAVLQGVFSGMLSACGRNWMKTSFVPFTQKHRRDGANDRRMALLVALHGIGQGYYGVFSKGQRPTPADCDRIEPRH